MGKGKLLIKARAGAGQAPRRRRGETPEQEMARALGDEAPRVGIREEALPSKGVRGPVAPSRAEREEHERTHIPYRDWCECCVRGRGQEDAHRQSSNTGEYQVPQFGADYWFLGGGSTKQERDTAEGAGKPPCASDVRENAKTCVCLCCTGKGCQ